MYDSTIHGAPAFAQLEVNLKKSQSIMSNAGSLAYMREGVEKGDIKLNGVVRAFKRALGGQSMIQTSYKGVGNGGSITFASPVPGDILKLNLKPGQKVIISRESYIAGSPSIKVSGKLNWRGIFAVGQDEGAFLPTLENTSAEDGEVWLGSYGAFKVHNLKAGQSLLVNNGLFLASVGTEDGYVPMYEVVKLGKTIVSSLLGGEGLGMQFKGPALVCTQSHNLDDLAAMVAARMPSGSPDFSGGSGIVTKKTSKRR